MCYILRYAFFHPLQLFRRRFALIFFFPFRRGHAVDQFARFFFAKFGLRFHHPVGKAVAAETCQPHQVDIFRIMPVLQMRYQSPECGGGGGVGNLRVMMHSYAPFP